MSLAALLRSIPAPLVGLVADVVQAIMQAPDPSVAARRAQEAARRSALDTAMKKAKPRRP